MIFRSSPAGRYPGFAACVICYQPTVLDEVSDSETAETSARREKFVSNPVSFSPPHIEAKYPGARAKAEGPYSEGSYFPYCLE